MGSGLRNSTTMCRILLILLLANIIKCQFLFLNPNTFIPSEPKPGQRCAGRNYLGGRRCCTPLEPCGEGEGDCDGPGDGGQHDGNAGCKGDLVCGSNNCRKFGRYYHEKDDCCEKPSETETGPSITYYPNTPLAPPAGGCCSYHFRESSISMFPSISIFPSISMFQVRGALAEIILEAADVVLLS